MAAHMMVLTVAVRVDEGTYWPADIVELATNPTTGQEPSDDALIAALLFDRLANVAGITVGEVIVRHTLTTEE